MDINKLCPSCLQPTLGVNPCPTCGYDRYTMPEISQHLPLQTVLNGQYLVGRVLGEGGFGITYLGLDLNLMTRVAIKEYFPEGLAIRREGQVLPANSSKQDLFEHGVTNFYNEARILARFRADPHIVNVENFFRENGTAYFVMEYIDGQSLKEYLKKQGGTLPLAEAMQILTPIMQALERVHAAGLLHRDVAPDNIYFTKNGVSKLLDFGSARFETGEKTQNTAAVIKPGYAPPEQYSSRREQGPWTDVYAVGATFYRVLTGKLPPEAPDRLLDVPLQTPAELGVHLPLGVEKAIEHALLPKYKERYQNMHDFQEDLQDACTDPDSSMTIQKPRTHSEYDHVAWVEADIDTDELKKRPSWLRWLIPLIVLAGLLSYFFASGVPADMIHRLQYGDTVVNTELDLQPNGIYYNTQVQPGADAERADASWLNFSYDTEERSWIVDGVRSGLQPASLSIPDMINSKPVTAIAEDAFRNNYDLHSIRLPLTLKTIGENAFMGCTALTEIELPEGLSVIDHRVFLGCTHLSQVFIPDSVSQISDYAFLDVPNLTINCHAGSYAAAWAVRTGREYSIV